MPLSVFTSETASAPALSAAAAHRARIDGVGRELHDQRLVGQRPQALHRGGGLGRVGAHDQAGLHVGARHVQLDQRHLVALADAATSTASSSRSKPITDTTSGTGSSASRAGRGQEALQALVRQADRVDHPGGGLPQPRRRVALAGLDGDRLRDEAVEGEALQQGVAECAPGRDRVEGARPIEDRAAQLHAAEAPGSMPRRERGRLQRAASNTGPSTHRRTKPLAVGTTQPKQAPKPQAMPDSIASWAGTSKLGAQRPHPLEHRRGPAGVDRRVGSPVQRSRSGSVTSPGAPPTRRR